MIADLHCHFFPAAAASRAGTSIDLTLAGGAWRMSADGASTTLDPGLIDLDWNLAEMRRQGVGRRALAVPPFLLQYALPAGEGERWARAINDGIAEAIAPYPEQLAGFATVPLQDVPAAVAELERAVVELGFRGVEIATNIAGVELDDESLEPFWDVAQRLGTPILVHPHDVAGVGRMGDYYLRNLVGNPVETAIAGARLLFGGVIERYPALAVILSHGGGALPHLIGRLRHGYGVRPEARVRASEPIEHLRRLYYDTIVFDAGVLRHLVETVGSSQVVLGTDSPFDMAEPDPVRFVHGAGLAGNDTETILANGEALLERAAGSTR